MVQWLRLCFLTAEGEGSVLGQGTKIPQTVSCGQKKKVGLNLLVRIFFYTHSLSGRIFRKRVVIVAFEARTWVSLLCTHVFTF